MKRADPMRRALDLAARIPEGAASPNPRVGCVLIRSGRTVGEGWHRGAGTPHAEVVALARAGARARGADAYVTLEPCVTFPGKKTPSCAQALIDAGVRRVYYATLDPNPLVRGRGVRLLRAAGISPHVDESARADAEFLSRGFFSRMRRDRPWVILKSALSLDGRAATANGRSRWVTGAPARRAVHAMRADVDAVLVGAGTVRADNPALTAHGAGRDPIRVVLSGRRPLPRRAKLFRDGGITLVYPGLGTARLRRALKDLARRGIGTLLVEGGPAVHASFLRAGLVDEARIFIAPKLLSGATDPNRAPRLRDVLLHRVGEDWFIGGVL